MAALDVVEALAVEEDQGLAEAGSTNGEVSLDAVGGALSEVEGGVEFEGVDERVEDQTVGADGEHADGAVDFFEREGLEGAGDDDGFFGGLGRSLGLGREKGKGEEQEEGCAQLCIIRR